MHKPLTKIMHEYITPHLNSDAIVIDATCGNGHDTLFLAKRVQEVFAFDIQKSALEKTKQNLEDENLSNVRLIHDSHENMALYTADPISLIMFNLGYLPGGDHDITTTVTSSLPALKVGLELLIPNGLLSLILYPGHEAGLKETKAILKWLKSLEKRQYEILSIEKPNDKKAPKGFLIKKKG